MSSELQLAQRIANRLLKQAARAEKNLLLRWLHSNPLGGDVVVVRWYDSEKIHVCLAVGTSKEEQEASRPNQEAEWAGATVYTMPALH